MTGLVPLAAAYAVMIALIGWFTWQLLHRLQDVNARMAAVEDALESTAEEE